MTTTATYGEERTGYVEPAWRPMPTEMTEAEVAARAASLATVRRAFEVHAVCTEHEMTPEQMFSAGLLTAEALERLWVREESFVTVLPEYRYRPGELAA